MGCLNSTNRNNPPQSVESERNLTDAPQTKKLSEGTTVTINDNDGKKGGKKLRRTSAHHGVMASIAIKFPKIRHSFVACKKIFDHCAGDKNYILKSEVKSLLIELGARESDLTEEEVQRIIKISNLDNDDQIDFKEFLIAAAVGCFLEHDTKGQSEEFLNIMLGFEVAREAFNKIDVDLSGEIDFEELKAAFLAMRQDDLILTRLQELDFNGDKTIEFPEFVWGISAWVGMDDNGNDETEAQSDVNLDANASHDSKNIDEINKNYLNNGS